MSHKCGSNQLMSGPASGPHHEQEPTSDPVWMARNQMPDSLETQDRTKHNRPQKKKKVNEVILNDILLYSSTGA